jgi:hypothetical protein
VRAVGMAGPLSYEAMPLSGWQPPAGRVSGVFTAGWRVALRPVFGVLARPLGLPCTLRDRAYLGLSAIRRRGRLPVLSASALGTRPYGVLP